MTCGHLLLMKDETMKQFSRDTCYKALASTGTSQQVVYTLALSDQPKDCTVTSKRLTNSFLRTSYSLTMAWLIASIFSWNKNLQT